MKKTLKLFASILVIASLAACGGGGGGSDSSSTPSWAQTSGSTNVTSLTTTDNVIGTGTTAVAGDTLTVSYTGWLYEATAANYEGPEFDSSSATNPTFSFQLGAGKVISGWDQGLVGMKVGGTRTLIIPSALAYGNNGNPPVIPANAALVFTVQLVAVTPPAQ